MPGRFIFTTLELLARRHVPMRTPVKGKLVPSRIFWDVLSSQIAKIENKLTTNRKRQCMIISDRVVVQYVVRGPTCTHQPVTIPDVSDIRDRFAVDMTPIIAEGWP